MVTKVYLAYSADGVIGVSITRVGAFHGAIQIRVQYSRQHAM